MARKSDKNKENLDLYKQFMSNQSKDIGESDKPKEMNLSDLAKEGQKLLEPEVIPVAPVKPVETKPTIETNPYIKARTHILSKMSEWKRNQLERIGRDKKNSIPINDADDRMFNEFSVLVTRLGNSLSDGEPLPKK